MIGRGRALVAGAGLAVVMAGVAGCTGDDAGASPTLTPLSSTALPTTASPSGGGPSASPSLPAAKAGPPPKTPFTKQGAEVFVRSYYLTANQALKAGRELALGAYLTPGCGCDNLLPLLRSIHQKRQHFVGEGYRLLDVAVENVAGDSAVVRVTFRLRSMRLVDRAGRTVDTSNDVRSQTNRLLIVRNAGSWRIDQIKIGRPK